MAFDLFCLCETQTWYMWFCVDYSAMLLPYKKLCFPQFQSTYGFMALMREGSCSSAGATASHWPYWAACVGPRPDQGDVSPVSSGWTTVRPAATRGAEEWQKHPLLPLTYLPPSASSLSTLQCLFSGRLDFLHDGVVDEWRKRGMGLRGKDRHREW